MSDHGPHAVSAPAMPTCCWHYIVSTSSPSIGIAGYVCCMCGRRRKQRVDIEFCAARSIELGTLQRGG